MKFKDKVISKLAMFALTKLDSFLAKNGPIVTPPPAPEPTKAVPLDMSKLPKVYGSNGKEIPPVLDPLPSYAVFRTMFERKHGSTGKHPIMLNGEVRQFDCNTLYDLLNQIQTSPNSNETHWSIYGAIVNVIMHAHGEDVTKLTLN